MEARLSSRTSPSQKVKVATSHPGVVPLIHRPAIRLLGLDPSLRGTGYGFITFDKSQPQLIACGTLTCKKDWLRSRCLAYIASSLRELIREHQPETCAVESLFFAQNQRTTLILGEARGAALATVAEAGLPVHELAPRKVKLALVGYGAAQKSAVGRMVQRLLNLTEPPAPDAADALALALVFAQETRRPALTPLKQL
jgi:crossover junction endodeoxyribonuclease RuvC